MTTFEDVMKLVRSDLLTTAKDSLQEVRQIAAKPQKDKEDYRSMKDWLNKLDLETRRQGGLYN